MNVRHDRTELRGAVYRRNTDALVSMLTDDVWPQHALQLIGDGLLGVLPGRTGGLKSVAHRCVTALRERHWSGDAELADGIEAALGVGPAPLLRPLPVDLEELAGVLEGDPMKGGGRIDLRTGEVEARPAIEYAEEAPDVDEDDNERWLEVDCEGSREGYRDMELFIAGLDDADWADRLGIAIEGRGAFRRFKDVLSRWPELLEEWHAFSEDRQRGRARAWLAASGYAAVPR